MTLNEFQARGGEGRRAYATPLSEGIGSQWDSKQTSQNKCSHQWLVPVNSPATSSWSQQPRTVLNVAGSPYLVLATAPETNRAYSGSEIFVPPSAGHRSMLRIGWVFASTGGGCFLGLGCFGYHWGAYCCFWRSGGNSGRPQDQLWPPSSILGFYSPGHQLHVVALQATDFQALEGTRHKSKTSDSI